ncbi:MAG: phosphatase PAP2 family protein [Acidimicrobiia bacterium]
MCSVVLLALFIAALVVGAIVTMSVLHAPALDPASPRATAAIVRREVRRHATLQRFIRARVDPQIATGLVLTLAIGAVVIGGAIVGLLLWMVRANTGLARSDRGVATWGASNASDATTSILRAITDLGGTRFVVLAAIVVALIEMRRVPSWTVPVFVTVVVAGQNLVTNLVKELVDRARPDIDPLAGFSGASFPSGHSAAAAAAYMAFALLLGRRRSQPVQALLAGAAAAVAVAVAASRVLLGVHWLTDVLAGLALGWAWFALCAIAFGGRLLHFGAPVEIAERADAVSTSAPGRDGGAGSGEGSDASS